jgi:hypothetical protein
MAEKSGRGGFKKWIFLDHPWRRIALAVPISIILHLAVVVVMRPDYKPVSDYAVDMDVVDMKPGPPITKPPFETEPQREAIEKTEAPLEPDVEPGPEPKPAPVSEAVENARPTIIAMHKPSGVVMDAGAPDSGARPIDEIGALAADDQLDGGMPGGGICMHDLFPFSEPNPSWILWISLKSFRETALQDAIGDTLEAYSLGTEICEATGIDPRLDAQGVLVTAENIFDTKSFKVTVSYDSAEGKVRKKLSETKGKKPSSSWRKSESGYTALQKDDFEWHLGGSGRVLAVTSASYEKTSPVDAGVASEIQANPPVSHPKWPDQIECLSLKKSPKKKPDLTPEGKPDGLLSFAGAFLEPDSGGHWPVALFATRDPRAVGLGPNKKNKPIRFLLAQARFYFTQPVRVQGEVYFSGPESRIVALGAHWQKIAAATSNDPFLAMAGLGRLFDKLSFAVSKNKIEFSLELTDNQVRAALIFLQLQGEVLERHLRQ